LSIYYIEFSSGGSKSIFSFDSTSKITLNDSGSATSFPLESGEEVSDHYVNNNVTVSFNGRISDIKRRNIARESDIYKTTQEFISQLRQLKHAAIPFKVYMGANLAPVDNCVFESLEINQDAQNGTRVVNKERQVSSFQISFTAKQIRFASKTSSVRSPADIIAKTVAKEEPQAGNKQELSKPKVNQMLKAAMSSSSF